MLKEGLFEVKVLHLAVYEAVHRLCDTHYDASISTATVIDFN